MAESQRHPATGVLRLGARFTLPPLVAPLVGRVVLLLLPQTHAAVCDSLLTLLAIREEGIHGAVRVVAQAV